MAQPQPYVVTVAMSDSTACTLKAKADDKTPLTLDITSGQNCNLLYNGSNVTATFTSGTGTLTAGQTDKDDSMKLELAYTFTGSIGIFNFSGSGMRTYTGPRF
jgi:hypothetical protein